MEERRINYVPGASTLDGVVDYLIAARENGERLVINFNGVDLHSDTVTMNDAYNAVIGCTKEEYERRRKEYMAQQEEESKKAKERIPEWIERGNKLIYPERRELWEKCVNVRANDLYEGVDLDSALKIMGLLEEDASMLEVKQIFTDTIDSPTAKAVVSSMILQFSKKGPMFARYMKENGALNGPSEDVIAKIEAENREYEANQYNGPSSAK